MEIDCAIPFLKSYVKGAAHISAWDAAQLSMLGRGKEVEELRNIIDTMGAMSATSQRLRLPITNFDRILLGAHTLYLSTSGILGKQDLILAKGILKVGRKHLFIRKDSGHLVEIAPLCVLDFYVHQSCQRMGLGYQLFEAMLARENKSACQLGYDRPSSKLLFFLAKYYQLSKFVNQANKFVVFDEYFTDELETEKEKALNWTDEDSHLTGALLDCTSRKDKVMHGRRAAQAGDPDAFPFLDTNFKSNDSKLIKKEPVGTLAQPSYHRGRRHQWGQQEESKAQSAASFFSNHLELPPSHNFLHHPQDKLELPPAHRHELQEQARPRMRRSDNLAMEPRKWHEHMDPHPSNNLSRHYDGTYPTYPTYPTTNDETEHAKVQSLCGPSKLRKMDMLQVEHSQVYGTNCSLPKPQVLNFHGINRLRQTESRPPLSYPFWTEAEELTGSRLPANSKVAYNKTRSCYQAGWLGHGAGTALGFSNRLIT